MNNEYSTKKIKLDLAEPKISENYQKIDKFTRWDVKEDENIKYTEIFSNKISLENYHYDVCTVCGEKYFQYKNKIQIKDVDYLHKYKDILHYSNLKKDIDASIFQYEQNYSILNEMVLDKNGFKNGKILICSRCYHSLRQYNLPKFSLVNNLFIGECPEVLQNLTYCEEILISKLRMMGTIFKLKTSKFNESHQSKLVGNVISFPQDIEGISNVLPNLLSFETIKVILIGNVLPNNINFKKLFSVNVKKVYDALEWLKKNNKLYSEIKINYNINFNLDENQIPSNLKKNIILEHEISSDDNLINNEQEIFENFGLVNSSASLLFNDKDKINKLLELLNKTNNKVPLLIHPIDNQPVSEYSNPMLLPGLYPTLFPFGYGGFDEKRLKVPLSAREITIHYLNINCNRFRLHPTFIFFAFNYIQRHEYYMNLNLVTKKKYFQNLSENLKNLTEDDLTDSIKNAYNNNKIGNDKLEKVMNQTFLLEKKFKVRNLI